MCRPLDVRVSSGKNEGGGRGKGMGLLQGQRDEVNAKLGLPWRFARQMAS